MGIINKIFKLFEKNANDNKWDEHKNIQTPYIENPFFKTEHENPFVGMKDDNEDNNCKRVTTQTKHIQTPYIDNPFIKNKNKE